MSNKQDIIEEKVELFLDSRCYKIGNEAEELLLKAIYPEYEGTWGIRKEQLKKFIADMFQKGKKERITQRQLYQIGFKEGQASAVRDILKIYKIDYSGLHDKCILISNIESYAKSKGLSLND